MNRFLLVVALVAACASPALAGSGKVRPNHAYTAYPTPSWVLPLPRSERLAKCAWRMEPWLSPLILIGTLASLIRGIGDLVLVAATISSPRI